MLSFSLAVFTGTQILITAFIVLLCGIVWYSPVMLGARWQSLADVRIPDRNHVVCGIIFDAATIFLQTCLCAWLIENFELWTLWDAYIFIGFLVLLFTIVPLLGITIWEHRSWELFLIHSGALSLAFFMIITILVYSASYY